MTAQASKQDPLATLKHHASEGRMGPAAGRQYCLTMLSELTIITRNIVGFFFRLFLSLSCLLLLLLACSRVAFPFALAFLLPYLAPCCL